MEDNRTKAAEAMYEALKATSCTCKWECQYEPHFGLMDQDGYCCICGAIIKPEKRVKNSCRRCVALKQWEDARG